MWTIIAMPVAEGYKIKTDSQTDLATALSMRERLRASLLRQRTRYTAYTLSPGDEILPLYDAGMRFYFVESGSFDYIICFPTGARSRSRSWAKTMCSCSGAQNRQAFTRKLHELQDRGVIESRRNSAIAVKQIDLLATLAASEEA